MTLLKIEDVSKHYKNNPTVLDHINISVKKHKKIGVVGETGSGKSTLLKIIAGLLEPDGGKVLFDGERVVGPADQLIPGHPQIAYLSQNSELPKFQRVEQCLYDPYQISSAEAQKIYKACQIEHLLTSDTHQLSGGEKQRVALARLLMRSPKMLLLDEPFSNLDLHHKNTIKNVISEVEKKLKTTIILVSHEPLDVLAWADDILVMKAGRIIQLDTPKVIYNHPADEYVAGLFGSYNLIDPKKWGLKNNNGFTIIKDKIILRPEAFKIENKDGKGLEGKVLSASYYGGYEEVMIKVASEKVILKSAIGVYKIGDLVSIKLR